MLHGNVPPLRPLRPFPLIAGLPAHWYEEPGRLEQVVQLTGTGSTNSCNPICARGGLCLLCGKQKAGEDIHFCPSLRSQCSLGQTTA